MFFDSHAHLTYDVLYPEVDHYLKAAKDAGVSKIINICTDLETLERGLQLIKKYPWVYNACATTPHDVAEEGEKYFDAIASAAREKKIVAIGETGLDYFYEHSPRTVQKEFFIRYLELAKETNLPIIIHCRDAYDDFFTIIDKHAVQEKDKFGGVLHCFTGSVDEAKELIKRNWIVSFSGIITFKKSEELREAAKYVPISQMFIETDAPYLAPSKYRGKTNQPAFIVETAEMIAKLKGIPIEEIAKATTKNAEKFFNLEG